MFKAFKRRLKNVDWTTLPILLFPAVAAAFLVSPTLNIFSTWDWNIAKVGLLALMQIPALAAILLFAVMTADFLLVDSNESVLKREYQKLKEVVPEKPSDRSTYDRIITSAYEALRDLGRELVAEGKRSGKKTKLISEPAFLAAEETYSWLLNRRPNLVLLNNMLRTAGDKEQTSSNASQIKDLKSKIEAFTSEGSEAASEIESLLQATREYHLNSPIAGDTRPSTTGELLKNVTQMNQTLRSLDSERSPLSTPTQLSKTNTPLTS